jgi:16S rRNA (adenine1518-N6/adenine1519-N6)-dimethyltransferase
MNDDGLPPLRDVIARHGLAAKKNLGQNFLFDLNLTRRIARSAAPLGDATIVEVGPGPGGLTRALLAEGVQQVIAIERDRRALPALGEIAAAYPGRLVIIEADALTIDWRKLIGRTPAKIVANLPYNIATPLLAGWLSSEPWPPWFSSLTLMLQKEVALRCAAASGSADYGRLSILCQWRCNVRRLFDVNRSAFTPPPKVTSSIIQFIPRTQPKDDCTLARLETVTAAAFGQRRKMLRQSLKGIFAEPETVLHSLGLDPEARAETVPVSGFVKLAKALSSSSSRTR